MSYTVTEITLPPFPGVHGGTGTQQSYNYAVVPSSVPGSGRLQFVAQQEQVRTMLFQLDDPNAVPNWFGVAVPTGITDFTRPHLFFHPSPGQARDDKGNPIYDDGDYKTKTGGWPRLFYYMERLGYQLDGAARSQILIMPFLTTAAVNTGILPANWEDIFTQILTLVRAEMGQDDGSPLTMSQLVISSFSVGIVYAYNFRERAANVVGGLLAEEWDFDGWFSSASSTQKQLDRSRYGVIRYDQDSSTGALNFHVPTPRWADYAAPPTAPNQTHALIRDYMFLHAATVSAVGAVIAPSQPGKPPSEGPGTPPSKPPQVPGTPPIVSPQVSPPGPPQGPGVPPRPPQGPGVPSVPPEIPPAQPRGPSGPQVPQAPQVPPSVPRVSPGPPQAPGIPPQGPTPSPFRPPTGPQIPPQAPRPPVPMAPSEPYPPVRPPYPPVQQPIVAPPPQMHASGCGCGCCASIMGMVSVVATTATTAITSITAIAEMSCCGFGGGKHGQPM